MTRALVDGRPDAWFRHLFEQAELTRWKMTDVHWDQIDHAAVTPEVVSLAQRSVISEATTWEATQRFMVDFADDPDFTQWVSVWFYEETKHPDVMQRWLTHVDHPVDPDAVLAARATEPFVASRAGTLALNVIAEMTACRAYLYLAKTSPEPVLAQIATNLARDEARHGAAFLIYCRRELGRCDRPDRERRRVLTLLYAWLRMRERVQHPGLALTRSLLDEIEEAEAGSPAEGRAEEQLCKAFGHILDLPSLTTSDDVTRLLRTPG